jgi:ATP-dependent Clp protease ATP-binding subunit ClpA
LFTEPVLTEYTHESYAAIPELFNRLDQVVCFNSLGPDILEQIVSRNLSELREKLLGEHGVDLDVNAAAIAFLAQESYDPNYGARPLERTLQRFVRSPVARMLIAKEAVRGQALIITYCEKDGFRIQATALEKPHESLTVP